MACGASIQVLRERRWKAIDAEVRDIMLRVWGVEPISWGGLLIIPMGKPSSVEKMRASIEEVRQRMEPKIQELNAGRGDANLNWLDEFIREHEPHEHP